MLVKSQILDLFTKSSPGIKLFPVDIIIISCWHNNLYTDNDLVN